MSRLQELANILTDLESLGDKSDGSPLLSPLSLPTPGHAESFSSILEPETKAGERAIYATDRSRGVGRPDDGKIGYACRTPMTKVTKRWRMVDSRSASRMDNRRCASANDDPPRQSPDRWRQAVADADRFLRDSGAQAAALEWTTLDLFGAHPTHPVQRVDCAGLILLLHGDPVVAITDDLARIRTRSGAPLSYYRRTRPGAVLLWELS